MASFSLGLESFRYGGFDLSLAAGLKVVQAGVKLSGSRVGGAVAPTVNFDETVPVPYLGATVNARLSEYWRFESNVKYLDLSLLVILL